MFISYSTVWLGDGGMCRGAAADAKHVNQPLWLSPTRAHTYVNPPPHTPTHDIYKQMCTSTHTHEATLLHRNTLLLRLTNSGSWWGQTENSAERGPAEESQKLKQWELTMIGIFVVNSSVIIHNQHYTQWKPIRQQNICDNLLLLETSMPFNYNHQIIKTTLSTSLFLLEYKENNIVLWCLGAQANDSFSTNCRLCWAVLIFNDNSPFSYSVTFIQAHGWFWPPWLEANYFMCKACFPAKTQVHST